MRAVELQNALYALMNVPSVTSLLAQGGPYVPIYTDVPQDIDGESEAAFPFVSFGPQNTAPFNDKGQVGQNTLAQVDIWTREHDFAANKAIADAIEAAVDRRQMALTGWIDTHFQSAQFVRDPDGKTRHGIMLFRVLALG